MNDKGPSGEDPNKKEEPKIYLDEDHKVEIPDHFTIGNEVIEVDQERFRFSNQGTWPAKLRTSEGIKEVYKVLAKLRATKINKGRRGQDVADELTKHADGEQPQAPTDSPVDQDGRKPAFDEMVRGLAKNGRNILDKTTPQTVDLMHMALGIAGEAGEIVDAIKRHAVYNQPLYERAPGKAQTIFGNIIEELGDLEFYLEHLRDVLGITRERTIAANVDKLGKRYKDWKYSDDQAKARADKMKDVADTMPPRQGFDGS